MASPRRFLAVIACVACAAPLAACAGDEQVAGITGSPADTDPQRVTVESVTDGDTIRVQDDRRVRLLQIDTPETGDRAQCWGEEARDALESRLEPGAQVTLVIDPDLDAEDDHGRELRYVELGGDVLNVWLVREGHALPYFFRGERGMHAEDLLDAAREARSAQRGMWGACRGVRLDPGIGL